MSDNSKPRRIMDRSESFVRLHLHHRGFDDVVYEPSPNEPPDFLVNGKIAIEVRRLNQNFVTTSGKIYGLEEDSISLWRGLKEMLPQLGPITFAHTWSVVAEFSRPVAGWNKLKRKIEAALLAFSRLPSKPLAARIRIWKRFSLRLDYHPSRRGTFFTFGGLRDFDAEGSLVSKLEANIAHCSLEKERKIFRFRDRYPEWWLALTDSVIRGLVLLGFEFPLIEKGSGSFFLFPGRK